MGIAVDALMQVRGGLCDSIDRLAQDFPQLSMGQLCHGIDEIRRTAINYGLMPLAQLARGLETALADEGPAVMVLPWLDTMRDAAGCERLDDEASAIYLAAINVRMH